MFLRRRRKPEESISRARTVLSTRFLYYSSLMEKKYLATCMKLCEGKLKVKIAHSWLPSVVLAETTTATRASPDKRFNEQTIAVLVRYKSALCTLLCRPQQSNSVK